MKRWLKYVVLLVAAAVLIVGLWAPSYAKTKDGKYKFVYCTAGTAGDFYLPIQKGLKDAAEMFGVEVEFVGPVENDVPKLVTSMYAVIANPEVDGMIVQIYDHVSQDDAIQAAMDQGIPVITACADDENTPNARMVFVGDTMVGQGRVAGEKLLELLGEGPGEVAIFQVISHQALIDRAQGIRDILEPHGWTIEETVAGVDDITTIAGMIESYYRAHPDIDAIVGVDGNSSPAVGIAMRKIGKGKVVAAGFDLVAATLDAIKDGYVVFTFDQIPYKYGFYPVALLYHYLEYGLAPADMKTGGALVDISNVDETIRLMELGYR